MQSNSYITSTKIKPNLLVITGLVIYGFYCSFRTGNFNITGMKSYEIRRFGFVLFMGFT